jgi:hypothetical protein
LKVGVRNIERCYVAAHAGCAGLEKAQREALEAGVSSSNNGEEEEDEDGIMILDLLFGIDLI